jgi:hypothetical protein
MEAAVEAEADVALPAVGTAQQMAVARAMAVVATEVVAPSQAGRAKRLVAAGSGLATTARAVPAAVAEAEAEGGVAPHQA